MKNANGVLAAEKSVIANLKAKGFKPIKADMFTKPDHQALPDPLIADDRDEDVTAGLFKMWYEDLRGKSF